MSGHSPSRLRAKTADFADFFRSSTSNSRPAQTDPHMIAPQPLLDVPQRSESPTKQKKTTKIPFLGRTRKKSTHSTKSGAPVASTSSTRGYDSTEIVDSKSAKKDRWVNFYHDQAITPSSCGHLSWHTPNYPSSPIRQPFRYWHILKQTFLSCVVDFNTRDTTATCSSHRLSNNIISIPWLKVCSPLRSFKTS